VAGFNLRFYTDNTVELLPFERVVGPFDYHYADETCPVDMTMTLEGPAMGTGTRHRADRYSGENCASRWEPRRLCGSLGQHFAPAHGSHHEYTGVGAPGSDPDIAYSATGRRPGADGANRITLVGTGLFEEGVLGQELSRGDRVSRSALVTLCGLIHPWPPVPTEPGTILHRWLDRSPAKPPDTPQPACRSAGAFRITSRVTGWRTLPDLLLGPGTRCPGVPGVSLRW